MDSRLAVPVGSMTPSAIHVSGHGSQSRARQCGSGGAYGDDKLIKEGAHCEEDRQPLLMCL